MASNREPFSESDLYHDGPPIRLRDIMDFTGLSRDTLQRAIMRGDLDGHRVVLRRGSPWLFERRTVLAWWRGLEQKAS